MSTMAAEQAMLPVSVAEEAMSIPLGYKRTDVGVIPKDWGVKFLVDIAEVKTGPFGSSLHEHDYVEDGTPIITVEHLGEFGIVHEGVPMVSDSDRARLKSYGLRQHDIVFSRVGSVDRNSLVGNAEDGWLFSGRLLRVRVIDGSVYSPYLSYHFHSEPFKQRIRSVAVGQTMASLNTQILKAMPVVLPATLAEQYAIASALADTDRLLAVLDTLIAKKRAIKLAAMQQLLTGRTRLPGFAGEWEVKRLGDLGAWKGGGTPSMANAAYWSGGRIPWVSSQDVKTTAIADTGKKITEVAVRESSTTLLEPGAILIVTRSGILRRYLPVARNVLPVAINQDLKALIPTGNVVGEFLLHVFSYHGADILSSCLKSGTTVESIEFGWLKRFVVTLPQPAEQIAIAAVLSDMDAEIAALERRRDKTKQIKQGMMQDLLTGRVRLVAPSQAEAEA